MDGGKIPHAISIKDDAPLVFAGLCEGWKDPAINEWLHTCTILTVEPNEFMRKIHTRMPVILPEERRDAGLFGEAEKEVFGPFPADRMRAGPIDARVNSPKNNDPAIIVTIELENVAGPKKSLATAVMPRSSQCLNVAIRDLRRQDVIQGLPSA